MALVLLILVFLPQCCILIIYSVLILTMYSTMFCWGDGNNLFTHVTASNFQRLLASLVLAAHRRSECYTTGADMKGRVYPYWVSVNNFVAYGLGDTFKQQPVCSTSQPPIVFGLQLLLKHFLPVTTVIPLRGTTIDSYFFWQQIFITTQCRLRSFQAILLDGYSRC